MYDIETLLNRVEHINKLWTIVRIYIYIYMYIIK